MPLFLGRPNIFSKKEVCKILKTSPPSVQTTPEDNRKHWALSPTRYRKEEESKPKTATQNPRWYTSRTISLWERGRVTSPPRWSRFVNCLFDWLIVVLSVCWNWLCSIRVVGRWTIILFGSNEIFLRLTVSNRDLNDKINPSIILTKSSVQFKSCSDKEASSSQKEPRTKESRSSGSSTRQLCHR